MKQLVIPRNAPTGKYHKTGLEFLKDLSDEFRGIAADERAQHQQSYAARFRDQVELAAITHLPACHKPWRRAIRDGASLFGEIDQEYVEIALGNLIAGERDAKKKRKARAAERAQTPVPKAIDHESGASKTEGAAHTDWRQTHPSLASGHNPAPDSPEANSMAATEKAAYG